MRTQLEPTYIRSLPLKDAWGRPLMVELTAGHYFVWSTGHDGRRDARWAKGGATDPYADLVYSDGSFFQFPARDRSVIFDPNAWDVGTGEPHRYRLQTVPPRVE